MSKCNPPSPNLSQSSQGTTLLSASARPGLRADAEPSVFSFEGALRAALGSSVLPPPGLERAFPHYTGGFSTRRHAGVGEVSDW
jgi:hypothetical protein